MARVFIPQDRLDGWNLEQKVEVTGDRIAFVGHGRAVRVEPAVRFVGLCAGEDRAGLIGLVKSEQALASIGAQLYLDQVFLRGATYDVESGFLGDARGDGATDGESLRRVLLAL